METVTIPKKLSKRGDLVIIARKEYESLLKIVEKKALDADIQKSLKDYREGRYYGPFSSVAQMRKSLRKNK